MVGTLLVLQLKDADPHAASKGQNRCLNQECCDAFAARVLLGFLFARMHLPFSFLPTPLAIPGAS